MDVDERYRTSGSGDYTVPADNTLTAMGVPVPAGTYPFYSEGYYVLLTPLSEGTHTLSIHAKVDGLLDGAPFVFETVVQYTLIVQ